MVFFLCAVSWSQSHVHIVPVTLIKGADVFWHVLLAHLSPLFLSFPHLSVYTIYRDSSPKIEKLPIYYSLILSMEELVTANPCDHSGISWKERSIYLSICLLLQLQVIYKKFQIPCPFEEFSANSTAAHLSLNVSSTHSHEYTNGVVHEDDDSHCTTRLFTINSQVGSCSESAAYLACFHTLQPPNVASKWSFHTWFSAIMTKIPTLLCSSQTAYTIPILAFAFVCHPEVLPIYTELRK